MNIDLTEIAHHVADSNTLEFFGGVSVKLPVQYGITKFVVIEMIVAILMILFFMTLAMKIRGGKQAKGRFWNMLEILLLYLRDEVVRPAIGHKEVADRYLPYIWTLFFFVLGCNLMGLVPFMGSPTGSLSLTAVFTVTTLGVGVCSGMMKYGAAGFWLGQVPKMDLPPALAVVIKPMLFFIEIFGMLIKHSVLAIRLLANMFAGHMVIAVVMAFISATVVYGLLVWVPVTIGSIGFCICMNMLELLVALIQAYIISFLSALFIGMAIHQH